MKTKIQDPNFLAQLHASAYKTRLEADLLNLEAETEPQPFLLQTEYVFADKNEAPLLIIGTTMVWRDYVRDQVKKHKNPHFVSGECQFILDNGKKKLQLELHKGKAKPTAIAKAFKKYSVLKNLELAFIEIESIEEDMEESLNQLDEVKSKGIHLFKSDLYDVIKKKVGEYKKLNTLDTEGRNLAIDELIKLIGEWHTKHPKPSGNDAKIADALRILEKSLREQYIRAAQTETYEAYFTILDRYNELRTIEPDSFTFSLLSQAVLECGAILELIATWKQDHEGVNVPRIQKQRSRILLIEQKVQQLLLDFRRREQQSNYITETKLMSASSFMSQAGLTLKSHGALSKMIGHLEDLQDGKDKDGKTLDQRLTESQRLATDTQTVQAAQQVALDKLGRLRALQTEAQKWAKDEGAKFSNETKQTLARFLRSIAKETERILQETARLQSTQALREVRQTAGNNLTSRLKKEKEELDKVLLPVKDKQENQQLTEEELFKKAKKEALLQNKIKILQEKEQLSNEEALQRINPQIFEKELEYEVTNYKQYLRIVANTMTTNEKHQTSVQGLRSLIALRRLDNKEVQTNVAFVLRGNNLQSIAVTNTIGELGGGYGDTVMQAMQEVAMKPDEVLEIDPLKEQDPEKRRFAEARLELFYRELVRAFTGPKSLANVPTAVKDYCRDIYNMAIEEGAKNNEAEDLVGGIFFLRYVCPMITQMSVRFTGKPNSRTFIILSKLFQSQANRVPPGQDKEAFMKVFTDVAEEMQKNVSAFIKGLVGTLTEQEAQLADVEYMKLTNTLHTFAKRNPRQRDEFYHKVTTKDFLFNPTLQPVFMEFCKQEFSTENFECWLDLLAGKHLQTDTIDDFYTDHLKDDTINVPNSTRKLFKTPVAEKNKALSEFLSSDWEALITEWKKKSFDTLQFDLLGNLSDTGQRFILTLPNNKALNKVLWGDEE